MSDFELRRRIGILKHELENGRVTVLEHLADDFRESLSAVRLGPDGEIDLATVDSRIRSMALGIAYISDRERLKSSASLRIIQEAYFEIIDANFGDLFREMTLRGANPEVAANHIASDEVMSAGFVKDLPAFLEGIKGFWTDMAEIGYAHIEDSAQLKAVFGGDIFPSSQRNIASTCGIYVDTVVLPDPFLRLSGILALWSPADKARYVIKHALNLLQYRELALADVAVPIVVVLPDLTFIDKEQHELLRRVAEPDVVAHISMLFGESLTSIEDVKELADSMQSVDDVMSRLARPDRLLFDADWLGSTREQFVRSMQQAPAFAARAGGPGPVVVAQAVGRMHQVNDILLKSHRMRGTPLIDAPTSWQYFQWKLEYDAGRGASSQTSMHITQALLQGFEGAGMSWLGNVPADALVQLRKHDALPELRSMLSDGVDGLARANPADFQATSELVVANMRLAFADHEEKIKRISRSKWMFGLKDVGTWLAVGAVEVAAAATGRPTYGLLALMANQIMDIPKVKELPARYRALAEDAEKLRRSPVGLLFRHRP